MNKSKYTGWQDVFLFSFRQGVKAKAYYVSIIVFALVILVGIPAFTWFQNRDEKELGATEVAYVLIYDETGLSIDYNSFFEGDRYGEVKFNTAPDKTLADNTKVLEESEDSAELLLHVTYADGEGFRITFIKAAKAAFGGDDYSAFTDDFTEFFTKAKREAIEVTPEQMSFINQPVSSSVEFVSVDESGEMTIAPKQKTDGISMEEYTILLAGIVIVMMIINLSGGQIANGIVTEKSTRVVEYLMINIKPMALIVGKILANLLLVIIQMAVIGAAYVIGKVAAGFLFTDVKEAVEAAESAGTLQAFLDTMGGVSAGEIAVSLIIIILGVLFFCIIAGLAGASVSKVDELAEGMKLYQILLIGGSYIGIGVCIMEMIGGVSDVILKVLCIIPLSAPFVVPANLILGKVELWVGAAAILPLLILTVLLFSFTAKVYESMIFYNGNVLKLKDILQIAKNRDAERKEAE